ncbi:MAG: DNA translocase FtsK 4TM domain-containing protein, partial [Christensenella sp.]
MVTGKKRKRKNTNKKNEIVGIVIIGLAVFLAITIYMNIDSVFGNVIRDAVFGVCGVIGYVVPIILGVIGVLFIIARKKSKNTGKLILLGLTMLFVFSLAHLFTINDIYAEGGNFGRFIQASYEYGVAELSGGGAIGSLLTYWTYRFLGLIGSYIVVITGIAAFIIALTNLSIKKAGKDIGSAVKTTYDEYRTRAELRREKKRLYVENLDIEHEEELRAQQAEEAEIQQDYDSEFNMHVQEPQPIEQFDTAQRTDEFANYDPAEYRKVFSDTDIEFDDDVPTEVKSKRKIGTEQETVPQHTAEFAP